LSNLSAFKGKKIAIMVASGFNEEQFLIIQKTLLAAEGSYSIISRDIGTTNGWASNNWGLSYPVDQAVSETLAIDFDALIVPGGSNQIETLSNDLHVRRILRAFLRENEPVALAGVSTMLLTTIDAAKGRKVAASDADSALLIAAGAEIIDNPTVRDTNLISATSGETGISDLLEMLAQAINDNSQN
jgi:protease I